MHKLTLRPQSHTTTNATSVLPRVARVKGLLVLLGCRLCGEAISGQPGPASGWQGHERVGVARELPSGSLLVLGWVRARKKSLVCCPKNLRWISMEWHLSASPTHTRVCSTDEA